MNIKECIKAGLIGMIISGVISFAINYFIIPCPTTVIQNAVGNGISGVLSGAISGFLGVFFYIKSQTNSSNSNISK